MTYVKRVEITDVKGIAYCQLHLAGRTLTVLKGQNGAGKSSVLNAIASVFEGGSDPGMIRRGAKKGKVIIELSDGKIVTKTQTEKGAQLTLIDENGESIPSPQAYVNSLAQSFAFDPLAFVRSDKKKRLDYLLKTLPLDFRGEELLSLKAGKIDAAVPLRGQVQPDTVLNIGQFDRVRAAMYERRRTANVAVKQLEATVANLRKTLPEGPVEESGMTAELQASRERMEAIVRKGQTEIDEIRGEANNAMDEARRRYDAEIAGIRAEETRAVAAVHDAGKQEAAPLYKRIGDLESQLRRVGEIDALRTHIETQRTQLAEKSTEADDLNRTLGALDELRAAKLNALPVAGLEIRDGEVYRDGVIFEHLNTARQFVTAVEIGCLAVGELPLIIADDREHLDPAQQAEFDAALEGSGLQVIMAEVTEGPLRAEPQGALALE